MASTIDLNKVKNLTGILNGEKPPLMTSRQKKLANYLPDPYKLNNYLFSFLGRYHKIANAKHTLLTESATKSLIAESKGNNLKLYYLCTSSGMRPLPRAYLGQHAEAVILKDDQEILDFIFEKSGALLTKNDL